MSIATLNHCTEVYVVTRVPLTTKGTASAVCVFPSATLAWDLADTKNAGRAAAGENCLYTVEPTKFFTHALPL